MMLVQRLHGFDMSGGTLRRKKLAEQVPGATEKQVDRQPPFTESPLMSHPQCHGALAARF